MVSNFKTCFWALDYPKRMNWIIEVIIDFTHDGPTSEVDSESAGSARSDLFEKMANRLFSLMAFEDYSLLSWCTYMHEYVKYTELHSLAKKSNPNWKHNPTEKEDQNSRQEQTIQKSTFGIVQVLRFSGYE